MKVKFAVAVCLLGVFVFAGCGEKAPVDPYARISIRQALYGPPVLSKGFRYKLVSPEVVEAAGDYVLVRDGNVTTFITGASLAGKISPYDSKNITFNVVKKFSPAPHFRCENFVAGNDTVPVPQGRSIPLPSMRPAAGYEDADHTAAQMTRFKYNDTVGLEREPEKKYQLSARLVRVEEGKDKVWMLEGTEPSARGVVPVLRISSPTPAVEIVLNLLARSGGDFTGGVTFTEAEPWAKRQKNHVCGTVEIDYVKFMDRIFKG
ncbi:MAG TPA: hypothetical protein VFX92_09940 [Candidatus Krumholzibacteria bacterium]|nr:hypothetical protein [Candidatus Krumholzibacteria bacterium]